MGLEEAEADDLMVVPPCRLLVLTGVWLCRGTAQGNNPEIDASLNSNWYEWYLNVITVVVFEAARTR